MILLLIPSFIDGGVQPLKISNREQHGQCVIEYRGGDDFKGYLDAKSTLESAQALLADSLSECRLQIQSGYDLKRCLKAHDVAPVVVVKLLSNSILNRELMNRVRILMISPPIP